MVGARRARPARYALGVGDILNYLIWPFLALLLIVAVVIGILRKRRRLRELEGLAGRLGLRYTRAGGSGIHEKFGHFPCFVRGQRWRMSNTFRGEVTIAGRRCRVQMGDYRYREGDAESRGPTREFSYLVMQQPCGLTPDLGIRETGLLDVLAEVVGSEDIDFESAAFSRRFHVSCASRSFAYAVITPPMMEHMLARAPRYMSSGRCWWLCYEGEGLWNAARFERHFRWTLGFFERWPAYLLEEYGPPPAKLAGFLAGEV